MAALLWDASALAKRYSAEIGSDTVDALFADIRVQNSAVTVLGYAETLSTLLRKWNRGGISAATFRMSRSLLRQEVLEDRRFTLLELEGAAILGGLRFMEQYNINASDAGILVAFQRYTHILASRHVSAVLIASDRRLCTAAGAEGLTVINPESTPPDEARLLLATI